MYSAVAHQLCFDMISKLLIDVQSPVLIDDLLSKPVARARAIARRSGLLTSPVVWFVPKFGVDGHTNFGVLIGKRWLDKEWKPSETVAHSGFRTL